MCFLLGFSSAWHAAKDLVSVELLCELVVSGSLLAGDEAGKAELFAGFLAGGDPLTEARLLESLGALGVLLL